MKRLFVNGTIRSMDEENNVYTAIGTDGGRISFLHGSSDDNTRLEEAVSKADEVIDLEGKTVLPGFIDSHLHLLNYAFVNASYNMAGEKSISAILEKCREIGRSLDEEERAGKSSEDAENSGSETDGDSCGQKWIYGRGWNENNFTEGEQKILTIKELDSITKDRPILLIRSCGHIAAINSRAVEIIKGLEGFDPDSDEVDLEQGLLYEAAVKLCYNVMTEPDVPALKEYIRLAQRDMNACGITSVESDDFLSLPGRNRRRIMQAYREMDEAGELTVKVREQPSFVSFKDIRDFIDEGNRTGDGTEFFSTGPIKMYLDGSLGAKTAVMNEPYEGTEDTLGIMRHTVEDLQNCVDYSYSHDMQILIHAIGDGACDRVMDAYENAIKKYGRKNLRLAINHLQIVNRELFDRMLKYDIMTYIQPVFVASDKGMVERLVGRERAESSYLWKTMIDKGLKCGGGSDSPVESFDILQNIQIGVTRDRLNECTEGWHPEEKLSIEEAVKLFTIWNTYGSFSEKEKGSLEKGKAADMVILASDIFETDPHRIKDIAITETIVNGKTVYRRK